MANLLTPNQISLMRAVVAIAISDGMLEAAEVQLLVQQLSARFAAAGVDPGEASAQIRAYLEEVSQHLHPPLNLKTELPDEADRRFLLKLSYLVIACSARYPEEPVINTLESEAFADLVERLQLSPEAVQQVSQEADTERQRPDVSSILVLIRERQEAERKLRQVKNTAQALNRISHGMALNSDADLTTIANDIVELFQARNCGIALLDEQGESLEIIAEATAHPHLSSTLGLKIPIANNPSTRLVMQTQRGLVVNQPQTNPTITPLHGFMRQRDTHCLLIAPLLTRGQVIGTLGIATDDPTRVFTLEEQQLLEIIGSQLACCLENDRLYQQVRLAWEAAETRNRDLIRVNRRLQAEIELRQQAEAELQYTNQSLQRANQELERLASIDDLTQVANRRQFDDYFLQTWSQCLQEARPLSLLLCDIDHFKVYNDLYGHQAGDQCLYRVAQTIARTLPCAPDLVARYGGEEFVVVLPQSDLQTGQQVAGAIREQIQACQIRHRGSSVLPYITLSIGLVSIIPQDPITPADLISHCDRALYEAKAQGRNRVVARNLQQASLFGQERS